MRRRRTAIICALIAMILLTFSCLQLGVGKTQARYMSEVTWQMLCEPEQIIVNSNYLREEGQEVLLNDWQIGSGVESKTIDISVTSNTLFDEMKVEAQVIQGDLLTAESSEPQTADGTTNFQVILKPTDAMESSKTANRIQVRVIWSGKLEQIEKQLWADFSVVLLPPNESALPEEPIEPDNTEDSQNSETSAQESSEPENNDTSSDSGNTENEPAEIEGSPLISRFMHHFDPNAPLAMQLQITESMKFITLNIFSDEEVLPSFIRYSTDSGKSYIMLDGPSEIMLDVSFKETIDLLLDFSEIERVWSENQTVKIEICAYSDVEKTSIIAQQSIETKADVTIPTPVLAAPILNEQAPLILNLSSEWNSDGSCCWDSSFEVLSKTKDGNLEYLPLNLDDTNIQVIQEPTVLSISLKPEENEQSKIDHILPAGSYRIIFQLKFCDSIIYEIIIPFFVNYPYFAS